MRTEEGDMLRVVDELCMVLVLMIRKDGVRQSMRSVLACRAVGAR